MGQKKKNWFSVLGAQAQKKPLNPLMVRPELNIKSQIKLLFHFFVYILTVYWWIMQHLRAIDITCICEKNVHHI